MLQAWAARVLNLSNPGQVPSLLYLGGGLLGFLGILLLSGPFLRELAPLAPEEAPADSQTGGTVRFMGEIVLVFTRGGLLAWTPRSSARSRLF